MVQKGAVSWVEKYRPPAWPQQFWRLLYTSAVLGLKGFKTVQVVKG